MISEKRRAGGSSSNDASTMSSMHRMFVSCMLSLATLLLLPVSSHSQERQIIRTSLYVPQYYASVVDSVFVISSPVVRGNVVVYKRRPDGGYSNTFIGWHTDAHGGRRYSAARIIAVLNAETVLLEIVEEKTNGKLVVAGPASAQEIADNASHAQASGNGRHVFYAQKSSSSDSLAILHYDRVLNETSTILVIDGELQSIQSSFDGQRVLVVRSGKRYTVVHGFTGEVLANYIFEGLQARNKQGTLLPNGTTIVGLAQVFNSVDDNRAYLAQYEATSGSLLGAIEISKVDPFWSEQSIYVSPDGSMCAVHLSVDSTAVVSLGSSTSNVVKNKFQFAEVLGIGPDNRSLIQYVPLTQVMSFDIDSNRLSEPTVLGTTASPQYIRLSQNADYVVFPYQDARRVHIPSLAKYDAFDWEFNRYVLTYGDDVLAFSVNNDSVSITSRNYSSGADTLVATVPATIGTLYATSRFNTHLVFYDASQFTANVYDVSKRQVIRSIQVASAQPGAQVRLSLEISDDGRFMLVTSVAHGALYDLERGEKILLESQYTLPDGLSRYRMSPNARFFVGSTGEGFRQRVIYDRERDITIPLALDSTDSHDATMFTRDGSSLIVVTLNGKVQRLSLPDGNVVDEFFLGSRVTPSNGSGMVDNIYVDYDIASNTYAFALDFLERVEIIRRGVVNSTADEVVTPQTTSFAVSTSDDELTFAMTDVVDVRMSTLTGQDVSANARLTADALVLPLHGTPRGTYVVRAATLTGKVYTVLLQRN